MDKIIACMLLIFAGVANAGVIENFTDGYDVSNWTQSLDGGAIDLSGAPLSIVATSSNSNGNSFFGPSSSTDFTIAALDDGLVTFDWLFSTDDTDGASFDPFGWLLNGVFTQLTTDGLFGDQSGTASFSVFAGDTFGFRAASVDSSFGSATTTISNFSAPAAVPAPASIALFGLGLAGIGFLRRK